MNKPLLKIAFSDFWGDFNENENLLFHLLSDSYMVEISESPDLLIYSCCGNKFLSYSCPKIFYTGENVRPDFKECDFALSFDYDLPEQQNLRLPLYRWNGDLEKLTATKNAEAIMAQKTKFCCMVVSNAAGSYRNEFYHALNKYKQVDSGGKYLNNVGGPVANKMDFIKDYKFVLSFENSSHPGYTTEKIIEPMFANSISVYWGSNVVHREFNAASFVNVHQYGTMQEAVDVIARIDNDEALFKAYISAPFYNDNVFPTSLKMEVISAELHKAVERILSLKPVGVENRMYSQMKIIKTKIKQKLLYWNK